MPGPGILRGVLALFLLRRRCAIGPMRAPHGRPRLVPEAGQHDALQRAGPGSPLIGSGSIGIPT